MKKTIRKIILKGKKNPIVRYLKRVHDRLVWMVSFEKESELADRSNPKNYTSLLGLNRIIPVQMEAYFLALNKYVKEDDTVLDIGFGLGFGLNTLAIKAGSVSGVDIDQRAYEYCQEFVVGHNPKLKELFVYDGYNLPYPNNSFDILTCVDVLEHVEDYHHFINEMLRVSRRGVFISTPNQRPEYTNSDGTPCNRWHLREWKFEELNQIIQAHSTNIEWNAINASKYEGPFKISDSPNNNTYALAPFIYKRENE